jgi:glycosyltransferase involved in cell wall biosynthesis
LSQPRADICLICFGWAIADLAMGRNSRPAAGAELQTARLASLLAASGQRVSLVVPRPPDEEEPGPEVTPAGVRLIPAYRPLKGIPCLRYFYSTLPGFWSSLRRADSAVYYLRGASGFVGLAAAFCRRHGRRLIVGVSSDGDVDRRRARQRLGRRDFALYSWGLRRADAVVVQTRTQQQLLERDWGREGVLIRSLSELPPRRSDVPADGVVIWAGRARRVKRPDLFLDLARRLPGLRFAMAATEMVGERALYRRLVEEARGLPNLTFAGAVPFREIGSWFDRSWLLVNTSDEEGFPNTFLEAWGRGLPVVASVDPDRLLSEHGLGYLCRDVNEMVGRIAFLRERPEVCAEIGARARAYVEAEHSPQRIVADYRRLLSALRDGRSDQSVGRSADPRTEGERGGAP